MWTTHKAAAVKKAPPKKNQTKTNVICPKCDSKLDFPFSVLKNFTACPFCGSLIPRALLPIDDESIINELKKIVAESGGIQIFSKENLSQCEKMLETLTAPFEDVRDKLLMVNMRKVPQKLYTHSKQCPKAPLDSTIKKCKFELAEFGFNKKFIDEVTLWLTSVIWDTSAPQK